MLHRSPSLQVLRHGGQLDQAAARHTHVAGSDLGPNNNHQIQMKRGLNHRIKSIPTLTEHDSYRSMVIKDPQRLKMQIRIPKIITRVVGSGTARSRGFWMELEPNFLSGSVLLLLVYCKTFFVFRFILLTEQVKYFKSTINN